MNLQTDRWFRRSDLGLVTTFVVTLGIFLVLLVPTGEQGLAIFMDGHFNVLEVNTAE